MQDAEQQERRKESWQKERQEEQQVKEDQEQMHFETLRMMRSRQRISLHYNQRAST